MKAQEVQIMDVNSLAHTKWECKYHIVFAPKYRRQIIYKAIRADVGEILGSLCRRMLPRSYTYACKNSAKVFCIRNSRIFEGKKFPDDI